MSNLIFHYQTVIHHKDAIYLHEAFSNRDGSLHSLNPVPVEDTDAEVEKAIESDSTRYKPVRMSTVSKEIKRWKEEFQVPLPEYEDEEDFEEEDDYYDEDGEVLDLVEYIERNR